MEKCLIWEVSDHIKILDPLELDLQPVRLQNARLRKQIEVVESKWRHLREQQNKCCRSAARDAGYVPNLKGQNACDKRLINLASCLRSSWKSATGARKKAPSY